MTNPSNIAAAIVEDDNAALGIDPSVFDDAAMDLLFADFPVLEEDEDEVAMALAILEEEKVFSADPTGGAPSPW